MINFDIFFAKTINGVLICPYFANYWVFNSLLTTNEVVSVYFWWRKVIVSLRYITALSAINSGVSFISLTGAWGWEYVTSCLKFVNIREFYELFKIRKIRFITSLVTAKSSNSHSKQKNISLQSITLTQLLNGNRGQLRTPTLGRLKLQGSSWFVDFVKDCSWSCRSNCWRVNEYWIVDITIFLIQKLSAAFGNEEFVGTRRRWMW